jgi:hypothetical protein
VPPPKHQFLQEPHGIISQKAALFIATSIKTFNLTCNINFVSQQHSKTLQQDTSSLTHNLEILMKQYNFNIYNCPSETGMEIFSKVEQLIGVLYYIVYMWQWCHSC